MNRSALVASATAFALLTLTSLEALGASRFDADTGTGTFYSCQMEKGVFVDGSATLPTYRAAGSCNTDGALTGRWQATGTFDPATGVTVESIQLIPVSGVKGEINTFPQGQIYTSMNCTGDPWLNDAVGCSRIVVNSGDTNVQRIAQTLYGSRPRTSMLSSGARAALVQAAAAVHTIPRMGSVKPKTSAGSSISGVLSPQAKAKILDSAPPAATQAAAVNDPVTSASAAPRPTPGALSSLSPQAKANVLAEMGRTSQASSRPAAPPPTQSPATTGVTTKLSPQLLAAAKSSVGSTLQGGSAQTLPSASPSMTTTSSGSASSPGGGGGGRSAVAKPPVNAAPSPAPVALAALVRESDLPRGLARLNDNAIIIVGGRQLRAGEVKQEVLKLDDHVMLKVGGQHLRASRLKHELTQTAPRANWGEVPGQKAALNPQPLPPKPPAQTTPNSQFSAPGSALQK